jgi:uncharacterized protein
VQLSVAANAKGFDQRLATTKDSHYQEFYVCPRCERIYWEGSHYRRMQRFVEKLLERE